MIRVGFTGTQQGMTDAQKAKVAELFEELEHDAVEVHHGDCIGADADAHEIAENFAFDLVIHPPLDHSKRAFCTGGESRPEKPYLERNRDIVDETTLLVACPNGHEKVRSGTWSTIRYARGKIYDHADSDQKIIIVTPTGAVIREGR